MWSSTTTTTTAKPMTKTEELAALQQLIEQLGPDTYLGPWLADAFDHLAADIRADMAPLNPADQYRIATKWRLDTEATCRADREQSRQRLDEANATADAITAKAHQEADTIRGRAYQALRQCMKQLEA
jgi:hexokinase